MKIEFTTLRLQADSRGLIVLNLPDPATLKIGSSSVWLTHSLSHQDYILQKNTTLSVLPGKILIEGIDHSAELEVYTQQTGFISNWMNKIHLWLDNLDRINTNIDNAICVHAG